MKPPTYRTRRLTIRPYEASDYPAWAWEHANAVVPEHSFDWTAPKDFSRKRYAEMLRHQRKIAREEEIYVWGIFQGDHWVGWADVAVVSRGPLQFANLGYRILNRYWKKGYAREAVGALAKAALRDLHLQRLEAVIDPPNRASIALARSVGMKREGLRRKYYFQKGRFEDQVVYVALREDFGLKRWKKPK
ncbi:MAG: GNAT family N-acetyltransferase [Bdellovibrionota bacterium]